MYYILYIKTESSWNLFLIQCNVMYNKNLYIFFYIDNIPGTLYNGAITTSFLIFLRAKLPSQVAEEEYEDRDMQ